MPLGAYNPWWTNSKGPWFTIESTCTWGPHVGHIVDNTVHVSIRIIYLGTLFGIGISYPHIITKGYNKTLLGSSALATCREWTVITEEDYRWPLRSFCASCKAPNDAQWSSQPWEAAARARPCSQLEPNRKIWTRMGNRTPHNADRMETNRLEH